MRRGVLSNLFSAFPSKMIFFAFFKSHRVPLAQRITGVVSDLLGGQRLGSHIDKSKRKNARPELRASRIASTAGLEKPGNKI
jgi:hypothetical protein